MRVAVLADIHGNLPACEAVLEDIKRQSPDFIVAAGDLALRGAYPAEVVDLLASTCHARLVGNTDSYLTGMYLGGAYRDREHWKTELLHWTRDQLGERRLADLRGMAFSVRYSPRRGQDLFICHANPRNLEESLEPTLDEGTLRRFLAHVDAAAMAFGHLHFPYRRRVGRLVIADVASVGIPRDGDLRPAWGLFTYAPKGWRVQIRRVRYPLRKATQALVDRKVPGAPLLIHKMIEARYRHHSALSEAARRHSGLPPQQPFVRPPPGTPAHLRPVGPPLPVAPPMAVVEAPVPGSVAQEDDLADDLIPSVDGLPTPIPPPFESVPTAEVQTDTDSDAPAPELPAEGTDAAAAQADAETDPETTVPTPFTAPDLP